MVVFFLNLIKISRTPTGIVDKRTCEKNDENNIMINKNKLFNGGGFGGVSICFSVYNKSGLG
jgi:hypothetical protein